MNKRLYLKFKAFLQHHEKRLLASSYPPVFLPTWPHWSIWISLGGFSWNL